MRRTETLIAALLAASGAFAAGCGSAPVEENGIRIGDETLRQFQADVTTEAWLVAILGPPSSWAPVEGIENTKVFRYASGEESSGILAGLMGKGARTTAVTYFIITDGVVTRFWADRSKEQSLLGGEVEQEPGEKAGDS